jgi:hypothetical protein
MMGKTMNTKITFNLALVRLDVSTYFVTTSTVAQQATAEQRKKITADNEYKSLILLYAKGGGYRHLSYQHNLARMQLDADFEKRNLKTAVRSAREKRARRCG